MGQRLVRPDAEVIKRWETSNMMSQMSFDQFVNQRGAPPSQPPPHVGEMSELSKGN